MKSFFPITNMAKIVSNYMGNFDLQDKQLERQWIIDAEHCWLQYLLVWSWKC